MNPFIVSVPDHHFVQRDGETCIYRSSIIDKDEPLIMYSSPGVDTVK